jgi:hypothetical protein
MPIPKAKAKALDVDAVSFPGLGEKVEEKPKSKKPVATISAESGGPPKFISSTRTLNRFVNMV